VLRRTITKSSSDIKALRSKRGIKKGQRTKDSLHGLGKLLDKHHELVEQEKAGQVDQDKVIASLAAIVWLCDEYLLNHSRSQEKDRLRLVDDIRTEAHLDHGKLSAQKRYLNDVKAGAKPRTRDPMKVEKTDTPMKQHINSDVTWRAHQQSKDRSRQLDGGMGNPVNVVSAAIRDAGLTEAEIVAIKTFTADDFMYMNPAVANDRDWLGKQAGVVQAAHDIQQMQGEYKKTVDMNQLVSEGATHAGVMMQGLAKLPVKKGKVYRGARMTTKEYDDTYGKQTTVAYKSFVSSSTDEGAARRYAEGRGALAPRADQIMSVFAVFDCIDARDIKFLSNIQGENEWLLLPGATFAITKIEDDPNFVPYKGSTSGKIVHLAQVPKPPKDSPRPAAAAAAAKQPDLTIPPPPTTDPPPPGFPPGR
jgi:hypothetical protein